MENRVKDVLEQMQGSPRRCYYVNEIGEFCRHGNPDEKASATEALVAFLKDEDEGVRYAAFMWLTENEEAMAKEDVTQATKVFVDEPGNKDIMVVVEQRKGAFLTTETDSGQTRPTRLRFHKSRRRGRRFRGEPNYK